MNTCLHTVLIFFQKHVFQDYMQIRKKYICKVFIFPCLRKWKISLFYFYICTGMLSFEFTCLMREIVSVLQMWCHFCLNFNRKRDASSSTLTRSIYVWYNSKKCSTHIFSSKDAWKLGKRQFSYFPLLLHLFLSIYFNE